MLVTTRASTLARITFYVFLYLVAILFWCEFLLYYIYLAATCNWPDAATANNSNNTTLKALVLTDTHLLGTIRGHWFDKLRREWQMYRSFQSALDLYSPDAVFILGDIFDEGQWASDEDFDRYVARFESLFAVPPGIKRHVVTGNHDIGFHYRTNQYLTSRFDRAMNTSTVDMIKFPPSDIFAVRINSMAMENDGCSLCAEARFRIEKLAHFFRTLRRERGGHRRSVHPILLTHFPMFRHDESACTDEDSVPVEEGKRTPHRAGLDCFSKEASDYLIKQLQPRLILNGHVHHSCRVNHTVKFGGSSKTATIIPEWTVASFSWRNKVDPSFLLLQLTSSTHTIRKCSLPNENIVISTYVVAVGALLTLLLLMLTLSIIKRKRD